MPIKNNLLIYEDVYRWAIFMNLHFSSIVIIIIIII